RLGNWCCGGDTSLRQIAAAKPALVAAPSTRALRWRRPNTSQPFEESHEAISRRHRICPLVILSRPGIVASSACDSDRGLAASGDRRKCRAGSAEFRVGSFGCPRLSSPRRAQYLLTGPG